MGRWSGQACRRVRFCGGLQGSFCRRQAVAYDQRSQCRQVRRQAQSRSDGNAKTLSENLEIVGVSDASFGFLSRECVRSGQTQCTQRQTCGGRQWCCRCQECRTVSYPAFGVGGALESPDALSGCGYQAQLRQRTTTDQRRLCYEKTVGRYFVQSRCHRQQHEQRQHSGLHVAVDSCASTSGW
ncbi:hypothetical protein D3C85_1364930 [compost metagenome]